MIRHLSVYTFLYFSLLALPALAEPAVQQATSNAETEKTCDKCKDNCVCQEKEWTSLFDGKTLGHWKPNERPDAWSIKDDCIVCTGDRSHLFYMAKENEFVDFHFRAEVKAAPNSNSGIYFHTQWQKDGWPQIGYESQVNVTQGDPVKSGSIYNTVKLSAEDIAKAGLKDDTWWLHEIIVVGKHVVVKLNGKTVVDYTEPDDKEGTVKLGHGTFALQAHDAGSTVYFRKLAVKKLGEKE